MTKQKTKGFSLIELLVVIFIIGLISSLVVIVYDVSWTKSRDSKRLSDILRIQNALELYYKNEGKYPSNLIFGESLIGENTDNNYMIKIPTNPEPRNDGGCPDQEYQYSTSTDIYGNENYYIDFCVGNKNNQINKGLNCVTNKEISNGACSGQY